VSSSGRLERLAAALELRLLVTDPVNVRYLTGLESSNAAVLVDPEGPARLYTDFRYLEAARALPGVEVVETRRSLTADLGERLSGSVGFEADNLVVAQAELLGAAGLELVATRGRVEALRAVKDEAEVAAIRRASEAAERAFQALCGEAWVGRSERELAWGLRQLLHAHGVEGLAFETVVAAGPNGARPHAHPGPSLVEPGQLVVVDFGARLEGYCSDCTRTLSTGALPRELRDAYEVCLEAELAAVAAIGPGMSGVEADRVARAVIEAAGYGEQFGHSLGHGVGLAIHEAPKLSRESADTLEPGNVVTIEPGIYLPGLGGVRIEDLALVTEGGLELLTSLPKELVQAG
jgi:Xaa-Pro aminopeptidase